MGETKNEAGDGSIIGLLVLKDKASKQLIPTVFTLIQLDIVSYHHLLCVFFFSLSFSPSTTLVCNVGLSCFQIFKNHSRLTEL